MKTDIMAAVSSRKENNPIVLEQLLGKIKTPVDPICNSYNETTRKKKS